jgi:hypothetical protein
LNELEVNHDIFLDRIIAVKGLDVSFEILQLVKEGRVPTHVVVSIALVRLPLNPVGQGKALMSQNTNEYLPREPDRERHPNHGIAVTRDQWWIGLTS